MKNLILLTLATLSLIGCASADKVAMPSGKWKLINQSGFVPASTQRYIEGVDIKVKEDNVDTLINEDEGVADSDTATKPSNNEVL